MELSLQSLNEFYHKINQGLVLIEEELTKVVVEDFTNQLEIQVCCNDCVLFGNEYALLDKCPNPSCGEPRCKRD
ncbi:hypothetical protein V2J09_017793 [Rumex salicifolius]